MSAEHAGMAAEDLGHYGIPPVPPSTPGALTCGACGRSWAEDITPARRCPWEDRHDEEDEDYVDPLTAAGPLVCAECGRDDATGYVVTILDVTDAKNTRTEVCLACHTEQENDQ